MLFSIITICKNESENIRITMDSVLQQTYTNYEYIIVDGASEDGTIEIVNSYEKKHLKIISEPDRGISNAFNKGINASSGNLLFFLNCGDYFINDHILNSVDADIQKYEADIYTYAVTSMMDLQWPESKKAGEACWEKSLIPHQGTFIKREVFDQIGLFNENFKIRMDYDFFCRCRKEKKSFFYNPVVITYYDTSGISSMNRYCFEKEGLAIRLIYNDRVENNEKEIIDFLTNKKNRELNYIEKINIQNKIIEKDHKIIVAMYRWLELINKGCSPSDYLLSQGYNRVAIYGFGMLGKALYTELLQKHITVPYIVDQNIDIEDKHVISWDMEWSLVDCIVVTPFYAYKEIKKQIKKEKGDYNIISLEDILRDTK